MAIVTDSIVDVGTNTEFKIGLSKYIGQYSEDEIWNYPYCSSQWRFYQHIGDTSYEDYAPGGAGEPYNLQFPLKWVARNTQTGALDFDPGEIAYNQPGGIYARIIWLYSSTSPISQAFPNFNRSITSGSSVNIITSMDMTRCRLHCYDVVIGNYITHISPHDQTNYVNFDEFKIIEHVGSTTNYEPPSHGVIFPAIMFKWNNKLHIHRLFQDMYRSLDWSWWLSTSDTDKNVQGYEWNAQSQSFDGQQGVYFPINIYRQFTNLYPLSLEDHESWTVDFKGDVGAIYQWQYGYHTGGRINPANQDTYVEAISWYGMMFEHKGVQYKPIIEDGYVTGYTDDMTYPSDIDTWTDTTKHDVPPSPPGPGPGPAGDDIDPNSFGGGSRLGGVNNLWLLTAQQLADLHTAMNTNNDPNFEPLNSIISVLGLAISPLYIFGNDISTLTNITIKKADGTPWSSGVNGHICSSQVSSFGLTGNISIQRRYNNFLDYPPYASHEIFLPLCGWIPLPSCCVGRKLSVYYVPDIQTGGVRGLVLCDGCIVGEKYGILGANIPFTSNGHGLMLGGIISGGVQTLADFATAMGGLATGNAMATVYGGSSFFSDGFNMALAANQNRTSVIGQNQDRTGFSDGTIIRIKSVYQDVKIDPLFGHTVGYLCHESGTLNSFHGFTVCENPHVHISATSAEKEEIKRLLEEGVILPAPSE